MKWIPRPLATLAFVAAAAVLIHTSVFVTGWPYTAPILALVFGLGYATTARPVPWVRVPVCFTILFGLFHFLIGPLLRQVDLWHYVGIIKTTQKVCYRYATRHEGRFPDGKSSNEVFRQLFIEGFVDEETVFGLGESNKVFQDGNSGTRENGYQQALGPGECAYYHVRGLQTDSRRLAAPLIFVPLVSPGCNPYPIIVSCEGNAKAYPTIHRAVPNEHDGQQVDIFSEAYLKETYGIEPQDILKPEGPVPDVFALAREQRINILLAEAALLAAIWLPFLLIYWIKTRRKADV